MGKMATVAAMGGGLVGASQSSERSATRGGVRAHDGIGQLPFGSCNVTKAALRSIAWHLNFYVRSCGCFELDRPLGHFG